MPVSYPITQLKSLNIGLTISPAEQTDGPICQEEHDGWQIRYVSIPDEKASLVYCPAPEEGLAHIQVREQTNYDLWLIFAGNEPPDIYLGAEMTPQPLKRLGQQAYLQLNWGNYVGSSLLRLEENSIICCELPVEVRSHKLDYLSDYRHLLDDISEHITTLIFDYGASTAVYQGQTSHDPSVVYLDYLFLRYLMDPGRLPRYFQLVAKAPHQVTQRQDTWVDVSQIRRVNARTITTLLTHPEYLARTSNRAIQPIIVDAYVPTRLLDEQVITTFDTPPNRFVKHFLNLLIKKLRYLGRIFAGGQADHLVADCQRWWRALEIFTRTHFLEAVGEMYFYPAGSQVLLKQEGYRQLNDYYRRFLLTGRVAWDDLANLIRTPNKDLATLYEYWCYFELLKAISHLFQQQFNQQDILHFNEAPPYHFRISLNQQGHNQAQIEKVRVHYNRYFSGNSDQSYSVTLHPDYTIQIGDNDLIIFDAKYRLTDLSRWINDSQASRNEEENLVYQKGDLYKMHTYRDALKARAVFILYPGQQFRAYCTSGQVITNPNQLPSDFAGVGAIPIKPGQTDTLRYCLQQLLHKI